MASVIPGTPIVIPHSGDLGGPTNDPKKTKQYGKTELFDLLGSNGFKGHALEIAAAIIMAESGGHTNARNRNSNGSIDRGIWQINNKAHPNVSDACAYDPGCATRAAYKISKGGTDWSPWNSSRPVWSKNIGKPGSLSQSTNADSGFLGTGVGSPASGPVFDGLKAIGAFFAALLQKDTWIRILKIAGGLFLVAFGLKELTGFSPTNAMGKVVP